MELGRMMVKFRKDLFIGNFHWHEKAKRKGKILYSQDVSWRRLTALLSAIRML